MRTLNNTIENNLDLVLELKDTEQRGVTTPRPPSHSRIEQEELEGLRAEQNTKQRITDMYEPRKKADYDYKDYLEEQMREKQEKKRREIEKEKAEDEALEAKIREENLKMQ